MLWFVLLPFLLLPDAPATKPVDELQVRTNLIGHAAPVRALAYAGDGGLLASGDEAGAIILWDGERGKEIRRMKTDRPSATLTISFTADARFLAAASEGGVDVFDVASGQRIKQLALPSTTAARYSADGSLLFVARGLVPEDDEIGAAVAYDTKDWSRQVVDALRFEFVSDAIFSPDGKMLALAGGESLTDISAGKGGRQRSRIEIWRVDEILSTGRVAGTAKEPEPKLVLGDTARPLRGLAFSGGGKLLAAVADDCLVFETAAGKQVAKLRTGKFQVTACAIAPGVRWLAIGAADSTVTIFDTRDWRAKLQNTSDASEQVHAMSFSTNGRTLAVARGNTVVLFKIGE